MDADVHSSDDDDPIQSCKCETRHDRSLQCASCCVCYFAALDMFNSTAEKPYETDIYEDDDLLSYEFGVGFAWAVVITST